MKIRSFVKDNKGQVLLMVIITSTIALLIVTGVFLRVLKLTRQRVEMESHEIAFTTAEKYARKILDRLELGLVPDQEYLDDTLVANSGGELVAATLNHRNSITEFGLGGGSTLSLPTLDSGETITFTIDSWGSDTSILLTAVYYDVSSYSISKDIYEDCGTTEGDGVSSCSTDTITYTCTGDEVALRIKPIGGDVTMDITGPGIVNEYVMTTQNEGTRSEAVLSVINAKSMPSLFDHVLYNGENEINKVF